jgi:hypothetical protein
LRFSIANLRLKGNDNSKIANRKSKIENGKAEEERMMLDRLKGLFGRRRARPELAERVRRRRDGLGVKLFPGHSVETYKRMRRDPQIALGLALLKAPVVGLRWWIEPQGEGRKAKTILDFRFCGAMRAIKSKIWRHGRWSWSKDSSVPSGAA